MAEYLKTPEAAAYTRMSVPNLERKRLRGDGPPFVKAGKSVIYRRADLDCQIASKGDPFFAPNKDPLEVSECCASEGSAR